MEHHLSHGGNIYRAARGSSRAALDFCDFSASINPLGVPQAVRRILRSAIPKILHYPDPDSWTLRQAIATRHRIHPNNILLGNGTTELIYALPAALNIRHGLLIGPTFSEYERALELADSGCTYVFATSKENYVPPLHETAALIQKRPKKGKGSSGHLRVRSSTIDAVILCNPNSPTGQSVSQKSVLQFFKKVKGQKGKLIVDETFVDFCEEQSVISRAVREDSLLVLRSFTKFFAIPGLRIGYVVGTKPTIQCIRERLPPWSVNVLAQEAAKACLTDWEFQTNSLINLQNAREHFQQQLQKIPGLLVYRSSANFVLVELPKPVLSRQVTSALKKHGLLVRDCSNYPGLNDRTLRFAVRSSKDNRRLVKLLRTILKVSS